VLAVDDELNTYILDESLQTHLLHKHVDSEVLLQRMHDLRDEKCNPEISNAFLESALSRIEA
jgi:hypothetical protein